MHYKRLIEVGRIVIVNFGPSKGKIGIIVDIVDKNRCIIDGWTGRQVTNVKRFMLTKLKLKLDKKLSSNKIRDELIKEFHILSKWQNGIWAQKNFLKEKRKEMSDFDRFKYMVGKKNRNILVKVK
nr:60S ribosomal protein L14A [Cryptomonas sp.]